MPIIDAAMAENIYHPVKIFMEWPGYLRIGANRTGLACGTNRMGKSQEIFFKRLVACMGIERFVENRNCSSQTVNIPAER